MFDRAKGAVMDAPFDRILSSLNPQNYSSETDLRGVMRERFEHEYAKRFADGKLEGARDAIRQASSEADLFCRRLDLAKAFALETLHAAFKNANITSLAIEGCVRRSVSLADALLAELAKPKEAK